MLQYLINMSIAEGDCWLTFSDEDLEQIRNATPGESIDLENYRAFLASDHTLALAKKPALADSAVVPYRRLCSKLAEAEIAANEVRHYG